MPVGYQGTPGVLNSGQPTLVPGFYDAVVNAKGGLDYKSPAQMAADYGRTNATVAATIGGTITPGNTPTITLTHKALPGGSVSYTHTVVASETTAGVAAALSDGLDAAIAASGVSLPIATGVGTTTLASESIITVNWNGPVGNSGVLSFATLGTLTATLAPVGGALTGGSGVVFAGNNFTYQYRNSVLTFYYGKAYRPDSVLLAKLLADNMPIA